MTRLTAGRLLRESISRRPIQSFIGVYDVFSATLAAKQFDGLFVSGFGLAASYHGLPDVGFVTWSDVVEFVQRLRVVLPEQHIVVDIDDGYGDPEVAAHVVTVLERAGASAVVLEDQRRPRRCGHVGGKQILELDEYLAKLHRVLEARRELVVVARTDATDDAERIRRACAFDDAGADAVLVDGIERLDLLRLIASRIDKPLMFNQIAGGKSPRCSLSELSELGVSLVNYSTPCLFA
ncbi:MAG TPA: isocitrate lyase/PEP mutase family protein, partial [Tepidisphaeraceae bacterium]|nr:isocitrate lyase/PEP mutase family protein [Tepidisphaeraceae bacterium]